MPAQYIYTHSAGSNVDLSGQVRAYRTVMTMNAEEGSTAISTFIVDDMPGGLDIKGHRQIDWRESSESSNSLLIGRYFTQARDVSRGPFKVLTSRQWSVDVADLNSVLSRRILLGEVPNRPAETDIARLQWLIGTTAIGVAGFINDTTYLSTTNAVNMDANDYRNQKAIDVIDDCAQQSGKNYFLYTNELFSPVRNGLFYDYAHSTAYSSAVRLTNVLADVDSTTTFAVFNDDLKLNRDPQRVYSKVIIPFNGGQTDYSSDAIANEFVVRDVMAPAVNVHTAAAALRRAQRMIADIGTEEDRLTMSYLVPLARVNRLKEGHTFQVKFSHLPGYTDWTWVRALKRTVEAISEEYYKVTIEATKGLDSTTTSSCSTIVSSMQTYDSGQIGTQGESHGSPVAVTPTSPSRYPSVVIGLLDAFQGSTCIGNLTTLTGGSAYTKLHAFDEIVDPCAHTVWLSAYRALSAGSPGSLSMSWVGNPSEDYRGLAIYLPTAATSPVQVSGIVSAGPTLTLSAAPTPGNIIVMVRVVETSPFIAVPTGFTQVVAGTLSQSIGFSTIDICVRCVQTGDSAAIGIPETSFSHWIAASEWALT